MFFQTPSLLLFLVKGKAILFKIYVQDNLRQGRINLSTICDVLTCQQSVILSFKRSFLVIRKFG